MIAAKVLSSSETKCCSQLTKLCSTRLYHRLQAGSPYLHYLKVQVHDQIFFPKIACPAIVYAEIVVVIDPFCVGVCP